MELCDVIGSPLNAHHSAARYLRVLPCSMPWRRCSWLEDGLQGLEMPLQGVGIAGIAWEIRDFRAIPVQNAPFLRISMPNPSEMYGFLMNSIRKDNFWWFLVGIPLKTRDSRGIPVGNSPFSGIPMPFPIGNPRYSYDLHQKSIILVDSGGNSMGNT